MNTENTQLKRDGGSAFPSENWFGMSLRDYFAAKAMPVCLKITEDMVRAKLVPQHEAKEVIAEAAYAMADAMIAARRKTRLTHPPTPL